MRDSAFTDPEALARRVRTLGRAVDHFVNTPGREPENCFILIVVPFGNEGDERDVRIVSNGEAGDIARLLRDQLSRIESRLAGGGGHA
jgi:siroheme synthase (precorrin-2 oxidase/ferrochelatase)